MFRIALCDDDTDFVSYELKTIKEFEAESGLAILTDIYESGELLVKTLPSCHYDLILLDYDLNGMNGFETAKLIRQHDQTSSIAFVTVFYDFSREGYKFDAIRYLVKQETSFKAELIDCIKSVVNKRRRKAVRLRLKFTDGVESVNTERIICVISNKHYLDFYIDSGTTVKPRKMRGRMSDVQLDNVIFTTVRQGVMVNLRYVTAIKNGTLFISGSNGFSKMIQISDSRKDEVISGFLEYKESEYDI